MVFVSDSVGAIRNVYDRNNDPGDDLTDGWRLLQRLNSEVQSQPWKITIAEDLKENEWITKDQSSGGAGFAAQWGAGFAAAIRQSLTAVADSSRDVNSVAGVISQKYNGSAFQKVIYTENHDLVDTKDGDGRLPQLIWPGKADDWSSKKRSTLGAAVVMTSPGIPMLFQGQEFLSWAPFDVSKANQLDWSHQTMFGGIIQLYRDLIHLRRNWYNNTRGLRAQKCERFPCE